MWQTLQCTIWIVGLAQVEVIAGPGWIVLGTHGELHVLDVLFEVVEWPKDVLHSLHHHAVVGLCLDSLHVSLPPGSFVRLLEG